MRDWDWSTISEISNGEAKNPIFEDAAGWWFWDEGWSYVYGPFLNEQVCKEKLWEYARQLYGDMA